MPEDAVTSGTGVRQRLAQRRKAVGLTQEALAGLLAVERSTVVRWERGETEPLPWIQPKLAKALQVSADRLEELLAAGGQASSDAASPGLGLPSPRSSDAAACPRQLPAAAPHFTGRTAELETLTQVLNSASAGAPGTVVISAIGGTAGVGKTALALQWAHQVAGRFSDGQLYVNLRGYDPARPMPATDALARFLRALSIPGQDIPPEEEERAARYRTLLADKRVLIVLDNAGSDEQVRPLLPGSPACAVVVTSRDSLAGLVARDGATRLDLDLLPLADAIRLLRELIGERADAHPGPAEKLAGQCCRLPLALRVAAELAAARPHVPLTDLVSELADQRKRLDLLDAGGDPRTAVRAVLSWSYRHLDPEVARAFRLAGLHPGPDFEAYAVAALTGVTLEQAARVLDVLARAHLIQPAGPGRSGMHDLLRGYARELAARDGEEEQQRALTRVFDHYLHAAATAMDTLYPAQRHRRPRVPPPVTPVLPPVTGSPAVARAWLDAQRATLTAVVAHMAEHGWPSHATRLAATLYGYLNQGAHYPEAVAVYTCACRAACQIGDRAAEAVALNGLGAVEWRQGYYQKAASHYERALALCREVGDPSGQARTLVNLGLVWYNRGLFQQAAVCYRQALTLFREHGDWTGQAGALSCLGNCDEQQGRYEQGVDHYQQALALYRETADRGGEARVLGNLGVILQHQGHYQRAADHHSQALALFRETGDRVSEAHALDNLGTILQRQGRYQQAADYHRQALTLYRQIGVRAGEADALNSLGEVLLATGEPSDARAEHAAALGLADETGDKYQKARARNGLAQSYHAIGDLGQARHHWQQALSLYTELGAPEVGQVRAQLTAADGDSHRDWETSQ